MKDSKYADFHVNVRGQGIPLLMIHGIIGDGTFFDKSAVHLTSDYKVITYDRRGYGENCRVQYEDYSVKAQAEDAAGILRAVCEEPAWILGNSAGGLIATELALCFPELVRGMILMEPSLGYDPDEREKLLAWNRELNGYLREGRVKRALPAFSRVIGAGSGAGETISLSELRRSYQNLNAFMYGELNEVQHYLPPIERLKELSMPVFVGVTEKGDGSIFATSSRTAAELIGWPVIRFPGYHNVATELPEEFAERLRQTIRQCRTEPDRLE